MQFLLVHRHFLSLSAFTCILPIIRKHRLRKITEIKIVVRQKSALQSFKCVISMRNLQEINHGCEYNSTEMARLNDGR